MSSQTGNIRPTFSLPFSTLSGQPTSSTSTTTSSPSGTPTPSLSFASVPSQLDTCTSFNIVWSLEGSYEVVTSGSDSDADSDGDGSGGGKGSGKGGGDNDDNDNDSDGGGRSKSKSDSDSSTDISPTSILSIGIAGSYIPPGGIVNQLSYTFFTDVLEANIGSGSGSTSGSSTTSGYNYTFDVIVPPGIYDFFAILVVTSDSDSDSGGGSKDTAQSTQTFNFTSNQFSVVNGSDTSCVNYALPNDPEPVTSLPIPTFTPTTSGTSTPISTSSNNPTSSSSSGSGSGLPGNPILSGTNKTSLTHGAVAGIAVGSILGVLAILLLGLFCARLRRRGVGGSGSSHGRSPTRSEFKPSVGELGYEDNAGGRGWTTTRNVGNRDGGTGAGLGTGQGRSHVRSGSLGSNISSIISALRPGTAGSLGSLRRGGERDNANFVGLRSVDSSRGGRGHHASPTTPTGPIIPTLANVAVNEANRDVDNDSDSKSLATTYEGPDAIISQIPPTPHTLPYTGIGTFAATAAAAPYLGQFQHHQVRSGSEIGDHYETDVQAAGVYSGYRGYSGYSYDRDGYRDSGASTLRTHLLNPSVETDGGSRRESSNAPITPITPITPTTPTAAAATLTTTQAKRRTYITRKPVPNASLEDPGSASGPETGPRMSTSTLSHHHGGASTVDSHTGLTPTTTSGSGSTTMERMGRTGAATATASSTSVTPVIGHGNSSGSSSRHSHDYPTANTHTTTNATTNANYPGNHNFDPADLPSLNHKSSMGLEGLGGRGREVHYLIPDLPSEGLGGQR